MLWGSVYVCMCVCVCKICKKASTLGDGHFPIGR